jgi:steroid delta-isomerase-like uncharacterized protein
MQDIEHNKAIVRRTWEEVFPACDVDALDTMVAPDLVSGGRRSDEPTGIEGLKQTLRWLHSVFSDQRWEIHDLLAEDDIVACRLTHHGRHTGDLLGIPPTGKDVRYQYVHFFRFRDGLVAEQWSVRDDMTLMRQLGVVPTPGRPSPAPVAQAS